MRTPEGEKVVAAGIPIETLLANEKQGQLVVAALLDSKPVTLDTPVYSDATVEAVSLADMAGRDAFRRSIGLLLLEAGHQVDPRLQLRIGYAVDNLCVVELGELSGLADRGELCRQLLAAMHRLIEEDVEFCWDSWTVKAARAQLTR